MSDDRLLQEERRIKAQISAAEGRIAAIENRAGADGRALTQEERQRIKTYNHQVTDLLNEIAQVQDSYADDIDAQAGRSLGRVVPPSPVGGGYDGASSYAPTGKLYNQMFANGSRGHSRSFQTLGDFAAAVFQKNPKLFDVQNSSGNSEGVGADGGFYVPVQFFAGLMDDSLQDEAIRPGATVIPMTSSTCSIPMFDLSNRTTGIATLEGKEVAEGATATTQKAKVREVTLTARKVSVLVPTTYELLSDAPQLFASQLQQHMTDGLTQTLDDWFINGTGAGAPLGILNAPCLVSVAKDTSQVAATLTPTNIAGMASRLAPGSWKRATWIVSPSALAQLYNLTNVVRNVANTENVGGFGPAWFQNAADGTYTLLGRPLIVSDRCQAVGTKGDILLCDLRSYLIGIRQEAELMVDYSIGFKESEIWFRLNCRVDGQPSLAAAITPRKGSATLSPFVSLDTRS